MKLLYSIGSTAIKVLNFIRDLLLIDPRPLTKPQNDWVNGGINRG